MKTTTDHTRRAARLLTALAVAAVTLFAAPSDSAAESPINGGIDLQLGPYYPRIDQEFRGSKQPFRDTFGGDNRVMAQLDAVYYVWKGHGKLGVGGTLGYTRFKTETTIGGSGSDGSNGGTSDGGSSDGTSDTSSSDSDGVELTEETRFTVYPFGLVANYRWDYPVTQWGIPFAAKAEVGADYYVWKIADGSGNTASAAGAKGSGATPGYHVSARLEFLLDWVDPKSAAQFDYTWGVNNTYFFGEYMYSRIRDFDGKGFRLGDSSWRLGLAFEF